MEDVDESSTSRRTSSRAAWRGQSVGGARGHHLATNMAWGERCWHDKRKDNCVTCTPCPHSKLKRLCGECKRAPPAKKRKTS
jgi:hypothetical protein